MNWLLAHIRQFVCCFYGSYWCYCLQSSNHAVNGQDLKTFTINKMSNNLKSRQLICNFLIPNPLSVSLLFLRKRTLKKQLILWHTQRQRATIIIVMIIIIIRRRRERRRRMSTKRHSSITVCTHRHHHNNNKSNNSRVVDWWPIHRISNLRLIFRVHFFGERCGEVKWSAVRWWLHVICVRCTAGSSRNASSHGSQWKIMSFVCMWKCLQFLPIRYAESEKVCW